MIKQKFLNLVLSILVVASLLFGGINKVSAQEPAPTVPQGSGQAQDPTLPADPTFTNRVTPAERQAVADSNTSRGLLPGLANPLPVVKNNRRAAAPDPTVVPHYFGPFANYANSPLPKGAIASITLDAGGSGYSATPVVNIYDAYGTGMDAAATATVVGGVITAITVDTAGFDYSAPIVVIDDTTGTGAAATPVLGSLNGGIRKFKDSLPGLGPDGANNLLNYIPVATADKVTYGGPEFGIYAADYYEIALVEFTQKLHSDLPPTTLRGYVQIDPTGTGVPLYYLNGDPINYPGRIPVEQVYGVDKPRYLGPTIVATEDRPVRIKFYNLLPTTANGGDLFIPVDESVMGAGEGPLTTAALDTPCNRDVKEQPVDIVCAKYSQNRATLHLHGGLVPWISDGTPHQWTTPAGEDTKYPTGVSTEYVPDMWFDAQGRTVTATTPGKTNYPGDGAMTFYYGNQQSARLQFYHDHAYGITRLNVYAGEAAGYVITDKVEQDLINGTNITKVNPGLFKIPGDGNPASGGVGIPLIIQDKTFVDATTIAAQDPTWKWGTGAEVNGRRVPNTGDLWLPSVYMPVQNPWEVVGEANAFGRWQYGPWFWPPTESVVHQAIPNEYYDPGCDPALTWCEPPMRPQMPTPSMGMEAYMDTSLVNGAVYPFLEVEPKAYRFRLLNAANDRFYNLSMFVAVDANGNPCDNTNLTPAPESTGETCTEVSMIPALTNDAYPTWPADSRAGGAPDPATMGPSWIQIGTEGGFLPAPVVIDPQPITWQGNPGLFNVGNVLDHSLLIGNAERADVIVDFSAYAGHTIIVYNDAPTAFPALDPRYDYYTGNPSQMDSGGAPTTQRGYGPNTRTVMQIRVAGAVTPGLEVPFTLNALNAVFAHDAAPNPDKPGVFETSQLPIIVPQAAYNSAYGANFPSDASQYVKITDRSMTFTPYGTTTPVTITFQEKAIHDEMGASWDNEYGRMSGNLGLELPGTNNLNQNIILYGYASPPVDFLADSPNMSQEQIGTLQDGTTLWKITHNGVDTHPIHIHLANAQLINRVGWDGLLLPPDANELGWKETIRINPLESTIWAVRPELPTQPFEIPNSERLLDPTYPENVALMGPPGGFIDPQLNAVTVMNHVINYGWEYVWHCHILSHEEMDMMHTLVFAVTPNAPTGLTATGTAGSVDLSWTDNSVNETGFIIQRSADGVTWTNILKSSITKSAKGGTVSHTDTGLASNTTYLYRVMATNTVGDTTVYAGGAGFPTVTKNSDPSNLAANQIGVTSIVRKVGTPNPTQAASVDFTVTFSQDVTGLVDLTGPDFSDFTLTGSTVNSPVITNVAAVSGTVYTVTVSTGTTNGILKLNMTNPALGGSYTSGETYTVEKAAPVVSSINIIVTNPPTNTTVSTGVVYIVTFDKAVTGVDATDFALSPAMPGSSIKTVAGSGATYTVTAVTGAMNNASLRLDLIDNNSIADLAGIQLGGPLANDGDFTTGQIYMVDNVAPKVLSSVRASAGPVTEAASVDFTVTFSETVTGVGLADFGLNPTVTNASITSVTPVSGTVYTVAVNTGTGSGQLRLIVKDDHSIKDGHLNELGGTGVQTYTSGQSYAMRSLVGAGTYDDTNINWLYEGSWGALAGAGGRYNSTFHYSSIIGSSATIRIDSQRFKLVYTGFTNRGMVDVFVDGVNIATINQYNATLLNQMTWTSPVLSAGPHTVSFVLNNTNVSKVIDIDAIQVLAPPYTTPGTITNLTAALGAVSGDVNLAWTAVGNDGMTGTASSYQVRYSTSPITTLALWNTASVVSTGVPTPAASGSSESMTVTGLSLQQRYYFAVRVVNAEAALSALSNSPSSFAKPATLAAGATYDDTNINWIYDGGVWSTLAGAGGRYNSTVHYSQVVGSSATILIDSRQFKLIYTGYTNRGMVDVFVDGVNIATINQYNATLSNQMTWTSPVLSAGLHTVRFVLNNTNVSKVIEVDAIQVLAGPYTTPGTITNLTAALGAVSGDVNLAWTAVGDDGMTGTASSYQVRYSTTPITTQAHWDAASVVSTGVPTPAVSGSSESMTVTGLSLQQRYYFAVRVVNAEAVLSAISNSPSSFATPATLAAGATYDDTNINWIYDGGVWSALAGAGGRYNSTFHYSSTVGSSATMLINGTGFKLIYTGFSNRGMVDVFVDGVNIATINQYNATLLSQMTWTSPVLSAGPHTVRFVLNNTNVSKVIEVDAIQVLP